MSSQTSEKNTKKRLRNEENPENGKQAKNALNPQQSEKLKKYVETVEKMTETYTETTALLGQFPEVPAAFSSHLTLKHADVVSTSAAIQLAIATSVGKFSKLMSDSKDAVTNFKSIVAKINQTIEDLQSLGGNAKST